MHIRSFHIDSFGLLSQVTVEDIPRGLSIFLGQNEAGKSTCLDFFRATLTGYPHPSSAEHKERPYRQSLHGKQVGGSLGLMAPPYGFLQLTRRPGKGEEGNISLVNADGVNVDLSVLKKIMAGITREVYRNVFGFSLTELQSFTSLNAKEVSDALYGASFGSGLRSPGAVIKILEQQMEQQFKASGSKPFINAALRQWDALRQNIDTVQALCTHFDALTLEKNTFEKNIQTIREEKSLCERQRRDAERQSSVWKQWDTWRNIENRIARLEYVPDNFPENGPARLEKAQLLHMEANRHYQSWQERCYTIENALKGVNVDEALLRQRPALQSLNERKTAFRQAQSSLAPCHTALQRIQTELEQRLADLGPDWTCDRIRQTNRSLFARGELERRAADMQGTEQTHVAAISALEKSNTVVENSKRTLEAAQDALARLPIISAALQETERTTLRHHLAQVEYVRQQLPEKQQSLAKARHIWKRSIRPLQLRHATTQSPQELLEKLDILTDAQAQAQDLVTHIQSARKQTQEMQTLFTQGQETEEHIRGRMERLRKQQQEHASVSRAALDARAIALRNVHHLRSNLCLEQDRLRELTERLDKSTTPLAHKNIPLVIFGAIIMLCGLGGLIALIYGGITDIAITSRLSIPLSQWTSYLVVIVGTCFLGLGMPRNGAEVKRYELEQQQLKERAHAMRLRIMEMEAKIQEQCVLAELPDADPNTLNDADLLLEKEREYCITDERFSLDIEQLKNELDDVQAKLKQKQKALTDANNIEQQYLHTWHEFLLSRNIENVPSPDSMGTFFARVDAAHMAYTTMDDLEKEVLELEKILEDSTHSLRCMESVTDVLYASSKQTVSCAISTDNQADIQNIQSEQEQGEQEQYKQKQDMATEEKIPQAVSAPTYTLQNILDATTHVLEQCREADATQAERLKIEATIHSAALNFEHALAAKEEAVLAFKESDATLQAARDIWEVSLQELRLGMHVTPNMVRAALECMERCLAAESELIKTTDEKRRHEKECTALIEPLTAILQKLGRTLPDITKEKSQPDSIFQEDWIHILTDLLLEAEKAHEAAVLQLKYTEQLAEKTEELHEATAALNDAKNRESALLHLAETNNGEDFLRLAAIHAERKELLQRKADLEDALRAAAADKDFELFLASFTHTDEKTCETAIFDMETRLKTLADEEQENANALANVNAQLQNLTTTDDLAVLRQQKADLEESINKAAYVWAQRALAKQLLVQAKQKFEQERQPHVIRSASEIFAAITDGQWQGINMSLDDNSLHVVSPHGALTTPTSLSRGTQEQLYLALRLAYIRNHAAYATSLPIVMDDVLVNFDPERAKRTAKAMLSLRHGENAHQILFFTCHPHMADMLQSIATESQLFLVEKGSIQRA